MIMVDPYITDISPDAVMVILPHVGLMDPFVYAKKMGLSLDETLRIFPLQHDLEARMFDMKYFGVSYVMERNRRDRKQEQKGLKL